jgi:pimeloyl-ACP methyl ester carboxylesterase
MGLLELQKSILWLTGWMLFAGMVLVSCVPAPDSAVNTDKPKAVFDPVTMDPETIDKEFPPSFFGNDDYEFKGAKLHMRWWLPGGAQSNPTVIMLHGYPGNEANLDLARVMQRAGYNVLYINYRGTWGSGGYFTFSNALEDVKHMIEFIKTKCWGDASCEALPIDPSKVALLGHSMGGNLALLAAIETPELSCVIALDFWNFGENYKSLVDYYDTHGEVDPDFAPAVESYWMAEDHAIRIEGPGSLSSDILQHRERFNPVASAASLANLNIFLLAATNIEYHQQLVVALKENNSRHLKTEIWDTDHSFNDSRIRLSRTIVDYLDNACFN